MLENIRRNYRGDHRFVVEGCKYLPRIKWQSKRFVAVVATHPLRHNICERQSSCGQDVLNLTTSNAVREYAAIITFLYGE